MTNRGVQILQRSRNQLRILGAKKVKISNFNIEDAHTLGATAHKFVATATWICAPLVTRLTKNVHVESSDNRKHKRKATSHFVTMQSTRRNCEA